MVYGIIYNFNYHIKNLLKKYYIALWFVISLNIFAFSSIFFQESEIIMYDMKIKELINNNINDCKWRWIRIIDKEDLYKYDINWRKKLFFDKIYSIISIQILSFLEFFLSFFVYSHL